MALYHTHRPQQFDAVIGQEHIITTITNQITQGKIAHAYLFAGPRGVGKTTTARLIAKAVNVPTDKKTGEPDNSHPDAKEISEGRSIDVIEIDAASNTGVDHVREHIIENAQFRPTKLTYKVFIIDEVHMLSTSAFNALLKTLEEPPAHTIFILATTELHKLPATIVSRCQRYTFRHVPQDIIVNHLQAIAKEENITVQEDVLKRIAHKSEGCVRDAVSLLEQIFSLGKKDIGLDDVEYMLPAMLSDEAFVCLEQIIDNDPNAALTQVNNLYEQGTNLKHFYDQVLDMSRFIMIAAVGDLPNYIDAEVAKKIEALAKQVTPRQTIDILNCFLRYKALFSQSPIPQLPLEMAIIELCHPKEERPTIAVTTSPKKESSSPSTTTTSKKETTPPAIQEEVSKTEQSSTKERITEKVKKIITKEGTSNKSDVEKHWPAFLKRIEQESPSLLFILKMATIVGMHGSTIQLSVQHSFHQTKLMEHSSKQKILSAFSELLGHSIDLEVDMVKEEEPQKEMHSLAAAFGGDVVS